MQKRMVKNRYAFLHDRKNLRFQNSFFLLNIDIRRYEVVIHAGRETLRISFVASILLDPCRNAWTKNCYSFLHDPKYLRFPNTFFLPNVYIRR